MSSLATLTQFEDVISNGFGESECLRFVTSVAGMKTICKIDPTNSN